MFPATLAKYVADLSGDDVVPRFLGAEDQPWLGCLLEEVRRFEGRPRRELDQRLREPRPRWSPPGKRPLAIHTVKRLLSGRVQTAVKPRDARRVLFTAGARTPGQPTRALAAAAEQLGVDAAAVEASLFADLPGERRLGPLPADLSPWDLALRTNLGIARTLLARAPRVDIELYGNARAVVRHARLQGLICTVRPQPAPASCLLQLSGPYSLFRRTLVYGRALGSIVPRLTWCDRFRLRAPCVLDGRTRILTLRTGDPIFPARAPRPFDSRVEQRFAREFARRAPGWDLTREPEPVVAEGTLVYPDFALWPRDRPERRWLLEIVGFWTPAYLQHKLRRLRAARLENLVLCIDAERNCGDGELPPGAAVIRYRRHIDVDQVLAVLTRDS